MLILNYLDVPSRLPPLSVSFTRDGDDALYIEAYTPRGGVDDPVIVDVHWPGVPALVRLLVASGWGVSPHSPDTLSSFLSGVLP